MMSLNYEAVGNVHIALVSSIRGCRQASYTKGRGSYSHSYFGFSRNLIKAGTQKVSGGSMTAATH